MALPPSRYAQELRFELKLTGPADMREVATRLGISLFEESIDADGLLLQKEGKARIIISNRIGYEGRKQFTIAHEVGHFYVPHHQSEMFRCTASDIQAYRESKKVENEANEFAAEFLLPAFELDKYLMHPPNMAKIREISSVYTSLTATAVKVVELAVEKVAVVLSEAREIKWFSKSKPFPYWIPTKRPVHEWSCVYEYFAKGTLEPMPQKVLACAWCQRAPRDAELIEESVAFERLGMVLTLLYIPVNEEEEAYIV